MEKNCRRQNQQEFRTEKVIKEKGINYMSIGKVMIIHLTDGLIKRFGGILLIAISFYKNESIFS